MKTETIIVEKSFSLRPNYQLEEILEYFEKLNRLIRQKNNLPNNKSILWGKIENGKVRIGYIRNPRATNKGLHDDVKLEYDITTNKSIFQFVILDAINEWGLDEQVLVYGAPENDKSAGLEFTLDEVKYHYVIYIEIAIKKKMIDEKRRMINDKL
jgi:hypothetical protein